MSPFWKEDEQGYNICENDGNNFLTQGPPPSRLNRVLWGTCGGGGDGGVCVCFCVRCVSVSVCVVGVYVCMFVCVCVSGWGEG